jgi:hypothetical protein
MNYQIDYNSHISEDWLKYCSFYTAVFSNKKILYKEHYFNFFLLLEHSISRYHFVLISMYHLVLISRYHFVLIKISSFNKPPLTHLFKSKYHHSIDHRWHICQVSLCFNQSIIIQYTTIDTFVLIKISSFNKPPLTHLF